MNRVGLVQAWVQVVLVVQAASLEEEPCKEEEELSCSAGEALAGTPVGGAEGQRSSENQQKCFFLFSKAPTIIF